MTGTNKRYSYPRVTVIRIDVHHIGKTRSTRHTLFTLSPCMTIDHTYLTWSTYSNLSCSHQQIWTDPLPQEEGLLTQSTTRWLTNPWVRTQLLSHNRKWSSREKSNFCWQLATRLTGPIYQHVICTFNTCLRVPTHRSLTDTDGGLQPWRCRLSTYHSLTFPIDGLHFPPKGPARSPV
jgi:hypothetical protein